MLNILISAVSVMTALTIYDVCRFDPLEYHPVNIQNGCVVDALAFANAYEARVRLGEWSRLVLFRWQTEKGEIYGHAVCVFKYKGSFFIYDPERGSFRIYIGNFDKDPIEKILPAILPAEAINGRIDQVL